MELPAQGTNGLCPACLLALAMKPSGPKKPWEPPSAEELAKLLPQYEITRMLGRGGMGAVYQGTQKSLDRPVAIKILPAEMDDQDATFAERFKNEARSMAKLSHPGIVAVYDSGETADGLLYIVMEFIEGTDVQLMLAKQGRLHTEHAMAVTAHVCDALAYAHERGIIHRDIKPANIMVGYDGVVKVADFGLAKMNSTNAQSGLTQSGMAMGTPHFMAPEALTLGAAVDQRADIYAVGVMLYQMLTGKLPQGLFELPSQQVPGLDPRYDGIIGKALRENRDLRYPSVLDMRHDLDAILTQPVVKVDASAETAPAALRTQARPQRPGGQPYRPPQRSAPPAPKKKSSTGLILTGLGVLAVIAGFFFMRGDDSRMNQAHSPPVTAKNVDAAPSVADTPTFASKEKPFVNSLVMKFVPVPITGGPTDGQPVLFCIHETRMVDYEAFAKDTNRELPHPPITQQNGHPVVALTWQEMTQFCSWLTARETASGVLPPGFEYRLPSDHEWSCAAGIGKQENPSEHPSDKQNSVPWVFPWGSSWPPPASSGNYSDQSRKKHRFKPGEFYLDDYDDGYPDTAPVMSFNPNAIGLYDMGGNVWEMVLDWYDGRKQMRAARGAGFLNAASPEHLFSSARSPNAPDYRHPNFGFRCVVAPSAGQVIAGVQKEAQVQRESAPDRSMSPALPSATSAPSAVDATSAASKDKPFVNSLGMKFVSVPITGGPTNGQSVLFCIHETRVMDYEAFVKDTKAGLSVAPTFPQGPDHPAVDIGWQDATAFCTWLTAREEAAGRLPPRHAYRLPSDHEWSCAVGIGELENADSHPMDKSNRGPRVFPWGTAWPPPARSGNYSDQSRKKKASDAKLKFIDNYDDGFTDTAPVMSFLPNILGIYDLGGNVFEMVSDWSGAQMLSRVARGGGYVSGASQFDSMLSSSRISSLHQKGASSLGFRCVLAHTAGQAARAFAGTSPQASIMVAQDTKRDGLANSLPSPEATELLAQYSNAITRAANAAAAGEKQAFDAELARLKAGGDLPPSAEDVRLPAELKRLRVILRSQLEVLRLGNPTGASKDKPFVNSLGMRFVPVPGTEVLFCVHETRRQDYAAYAAQRPGVDSAWKNQAREGVPVGGMDDHPVVGVSWEDAQKFCAWLSQKEGKNYRLPTDEEWSYAVGIGSDESRTKDTTPESLHQRIQNEFPWGGGYPLQTNEKAGNYGDIMWRKRFPDMPFIEGYADGYVTTAPVMSFKPNKLGLCDMGGNVWEWVADWRNTQQQERVLRGGSFYSGERAILLSSYRGYQPPMKRAHDFGFRCVLETRSVGSPSAATSRPVLTTPPPTFVTQPTDSTAMSGFTNTLGMKFVPVPGTKVLFCIHETRYKDYAAYAVETQGVDGTWKDQRADGYALTARAEDHPLMKVSWEDAQKFCAWLSKKEGKLYRLPTNQEWSIAVGMSRGEKSKKNTSPDTVFPWGDRWPPPQGSGNFSDQSRKRKAPNATAQYLDGFEDGFPTTAPVMSFKPNQLGLCDLEGNVREWCEDWYDNANKEHIIRGGSWQDYGRVSMMSGSRGHIPPAGRFNDLGFRLVLVTSGAAPVTVVPSSASPSPSTARPPPKSDFTNTLGMMFIKVPGTQTMFCIHETRYKDYAAFAAQTPGVDGLWKNQTSYGFAITERSADHPVIRVSWEDAQKFCLWLSQKEGRTYRLPTDQEWSIAVGLGPDEKWTADTTPANVFKPKGAFPWGTTWPLPVGAGNYGDASRKAKAPSTNAQYLDGYEDGFPTTAPVMSFRPNQAGLYDMGGNVGEWVADWYDSMKLHRTSRGGSFVMSHRDYVLSSYRSRNAPDFRHDNHGFRVVLERGAP